MNCLIVILVVVAFVDYFITNSEFNDITQNVSVIQQSTLRLAELENVLSNVLNLTMLNMGLWTTSATTITAMET